MKRGSLIIRRPDLPKLMEIHKMDKKTLVTGKNPLDPWECTVCGLKIRMGFGFYHPSKNYSNWRLSTCSEKVRKHISIQ